MTGKINHVGWTGPHYPNNQTTPEGGNTVVLKCGDVGGCLFNIKEDPDTVPDKLRTMLDRLAKFNETYFNPDRGKACAGTCDAVVKKVQGVLGIFPPVKQPLALCSGS